MRLSARIRFLSSVMLTFAVAVTSSAVAKTTGLEDVPSVAPAWRATFDRPVN